MSLTPEYLYELADIADPDQLWRLNPFAQIELPKEKRQQLDAGVALRRHAEHIGRLRELLGTGKSLIVTPLTKNSTAVMTIDAPAGHQRLLRHHQPAAE